MLALALPLLEEAPAAPVDGSVSRRHDPMDAVEEALRDGDFHEVILSTLPHSISRWLHADLPRRSHTSVCRSRRSSPRAPARDHRRRRDQLKHHPGQAGFSSARA